MNTSVSENELIRRIARIFPKSKRGSIALGMGDDAALWQPRAGCQAVLTCDWFLEGNHFLRDKHPADAVGWKCLARAVSDIAAMGGAPRCFLLSMALPANLTGEWFDEFLRGLRRASRALGCELAGGDTTRQERVLINITVIGEVGEGRALLRSGAKKGDAIFVSGILGEAEAGLHELKKANRAVNAENSKLRKHLYPQPRVALGQWLAKQGLASAAMDLSDGLSSDLPRLCRASGVGARIDLNALPGMAGLANRETQQFALHGGDDYELLFTVRKKNLGKIPRHFRKLKLTRIGEITPAKRIVVKDSGKLRTLEPGGWDPFRE